MSFICVQYLYPSEREHIVKDITRVPEYWIHFKIYLNHFPLPSTAEDFHDGLSTPLAAGMDAVLSREDEDDFFELQIIKHHDSKVRTEHSVTCGE